MVKAVELDIKLQKLANDHTMVTANRAEKKRSSSYWRSSLYTEQPHGGSNADVHAVAQVD
jgi:hypothetical protein